MKVKKEEEEEEEYPSVRSATTTTTTTTSRSSSAQQQQWQANLLDHIESVQDEVCHRMDFIERELDGETGQFCLHLDFHPLIILLRTLYRLDLIKQVFQ